MSNKSVWDLLSKKYPSSEYALMQEVSDAAGHSRSRSADYIAVSLWPSRGLAVNGIELKSYRSDWLSELKNPKKAENIFQYCDFFWLLTTDDTIAKIEEIPAAWGWLCIKGSIIKVMKEAPKQKPVDIGRSFMCAMLKRAACKQSFIHIDSIEDRIELAKKEKCYMHDREIENLKETIKKLNTKITEFEKASGIEIAYGWRGDPDKTGKAVRFILDGGIEGLRKELLHLQGTSNKINNSINSAIESL